MSELMTPALAGAVAGLGVAMPMGAMSVLLLQEAMRHRRTAMAAAAGIAVVDLGYAALATAVGPWVASHVSPIEAWVRLASAAILLTIATRGLTSAPRPSPPAPPGATPAPPHHPASPAFEARGPGRSPDLSASPAFEARGSGGSAPGNGAAPGPETRTGTRPAATAFARYIGLTALNPTTALYFAALTTAQGATLRTGPAGAAFLLGVGAASLLWQQTLVVLGSLAGARISATARVWTFRLGYGLVAAYALKIAFPLPSIG
ncbi:LysE family transporter [Streptomyces sp. NPDC048424]|uniref:LysE family transporter n=1 Tax=Streptomyces sp. NPDC048424 TaxID=3155265 RepID=UPI003437F1F0